MRLLFAVSVIAFFIYLFRWPDADARAQNAIVIFGLLMAVCGLAMLLMQELTSKSKDGDQ